MANEYVVFVDTPPFQIRLISTVDIVDQWQKGLEARKKKDEWWKPIPFVDEDGDVVAVFATNAIKAIVLGAPVPDAEEKKP